jgi:selenide,water dikinase
MTTSDKVCLTEFSHGAGCGCKIAPSVLETILHTNNPATLFPNLLVGNQTNDDAAVYQLDEKTALIATTDFFAPVVDDAFNYGRIAAANAISDVYAMGGTPLLAIAILGWPVNQLPASLAQQVLEGARSICAEAGIPLAGGHSIDTPEPLFGLSVNGMVAIDHLKKNNTAEEGDLLFLTKPIGVGILTTAQKRKVLLAEHEQLALQQMTQLNKIGSKLGSVKGVHALTDVTGFGLLGHLIEMAEGSNLSCTINYSQIPVIKPVLDYLQQRIVPDATYRNWNSYSSKVGFESGVNVQEAFHLLPDPQTNGGLLMAVHPEAVQEVLSIMNEEGIESVDEPFGVFVCKSDKTIIVKK